MSVCTGLYNSQSILQVLIAKLVLQVCQRWYHVSNSAKLWLQHCDVLGRREGVGDLMTAAHLTRGINILKITLFVM